MYLWQELAEGLGGVFVENALVGEGFTGEVELHCVLDAGLAVLHHLHHRLPCTATASVRKGAS